MPSLKYKRNGVTYTAPIFSTDASLVNNWMCFTRKVNGVKYYAPMVTNTSSTVTFNNKRYRYNSLKPTIHMKGNNTTYHMVNDEDYNIPAGTYTPSAFRSLIEQYISNNGNRTCSNTFTAKVNGQTITVNSGSKIYYQVLSSSPQGNARSVYFGTAPQSGFAPEIASNSSTNGFTNGKAYVVYNSGGGFGWTEAYKNYANYSITIGTGICFS